MKGGKWQPKIVQTWFRCGRIAPVQSSVVKIDRLSLWIILCLAFGLPKLKILTFGPPPQPQPLFLFFIFIFIWLSPVCFWFAKTQKSHPWNPERFHSWSQEHTLPPSLHPPPPPPPVSRLRPCLGQSFITSRPPIRHVYSEINSPL